MATPTYTPIESKTLGSSASSVTFTSIPSTYTDLVLIVNGGTSSGSNSLYMRFNNDSTSIYSTTYMYGNGSSATPGRLTTRDAAAIGYFVAPGTGNEFNSIVHIQNYANTNVYKTVLDRANSTSGTYPGAEASVSLWRSTAAINRIDVLISSNTINAGTTLTLYGISNAGDDSPKANGGDVYSDASYWYHVFPMSANFVPNQSLTADILCIAGGGGGGGDNLGNSGGGGGAGGLLAFSSQSLTATNYTVVVGGGGRGNLPSGGARGNTGGDSRFGALTVALGGGGGGTQGGTNSGGNGGNGGGGTYNGGGGGSGSQGNNGGSGSTTDGGSGGGGGAGAAGGNGNSTGPYYSGDGGIGTSTYSSWGLATATGENISGTVYYAGGGGGGTNNGHAKPGGLGGGGGDGFYNVKVARAGLPATGGGGSGGGGGGAGSTNGGSGVVIVRYLKA
jgi:hypothetical protein